MSVRHILTISGSVQGVGFRPFVFRLAKTHSLVGSIRNGPRGVIIDVQGDPTALHQFQQDLVTQKPERAVISTIESQHCENGSATHFEIAPSLSETMSDLPLLPDTALCSDCFHELFDPHNRRYHYPFLHCMTCGPRFSLFEKMPFDRENTAMAAFTQCPECVKEYHDPENRRFYSQTNCCPSCGPQLTLYTPKKNLLAEGSEALQEAISLLKKGNIVALKNTGGFLLLVDAQNEEAVLTLRHRKQRKKKPFAVLMPSINAANKYAHLDPASTAILTAPAAPIVLLKKREPFAPSVVCDSPYHGIMLAHNALHHLIGTQIEALVATSGNRSGSPPCIDDEQAFSHLASIADVFLTHNRSIVHRVDDSVVHVIEGRPMLLRQGRGYTPTSLHLPHLPPLSGLFWGAGGHLKNSFALARKHTIYPSQHIGDLDSIESSEAYEQEVSAWKHLLNETPTQGARDLHPDYYTTHSLARQNIPTRVVQHHRAHVYSCMADNGLTPPFLGISWDGTGLGDDQTLWGGEVFVTQGYDLARFATLSPFRLPGGERAIREPRRSLLGMLYTLFGREMPPLTLFTREESAVLCTVLERTINAPLCSSMGRLFDAVSALLDCCFINDFEGEAALALETLALACSEGSPKVAYEFEIIQKKELFVIGWQRVLDEMLTHKNAGITRSHIARAFHISLARLIVQLARHARTQNVLLTGGCMQNKLLLETAIVLLREAGLTPFWHHTIPPNDGGLAVGQIIGSFY